VRIRADGPDHADTMLNKYREMDNVVLCRTGAELEPGRIRAILVEYRQDSCSGALISRYTRGGYAAFRQQLVPAHTVGALNQNPIPPGG